MDDFSETSPESLAERAVGEADLLRRTIEHWGASSIQVRAYLEFGIPFSASLIQSEADFDEISKWVPRASAVAGGVLLDTTTILTAIELLDGDPYRGALTPLTLWDLATFVTAIISNRRVFHFQTRFRELAVEWILAWIC